MRTRHIPRLVAASLAAPTLALAQGTVTETRQIDEVVDIVTPSGQFEISEFVGLLSPTDHDHGQLVFLDIAIDFTISIDVTFDNPTNQPRDYGLTGALDLQFLHDTDLCAQYDSVSVSSLVATVNPGGTLTRTVTWSETLDWSGFDFFPGCSFDWTWDRASVIEFWELPFGFGIDGSEIPTTDGVTVTRAEMHLDGSYTVEWTPNQFDHVSVCDGNYGSPTTLTPGGAEGNVWFTQTGLPVTWGLLARSDTATSMVPASGICLGGSVVRLADSLSVGGVEFRFDAAPALSGTRQFFQSAFRVPGGGFRTGECVGFVLP